MTGNKVFELDRNPDLFTDYLTDNLYDISMRGSNQ